MSAGQHVDIGVSAMVIIWTLVSISIVITVARLYTQARISHQLGLSDWLIVVSTITITIFGCLIIIEHGYGWGTHQQYIGSSQLIKALELNFITQTFAIAAPTFGRMSFIVLMFKLFGVNRTLRYGLWALFIAQFTINLLVTILIFSQCSNVRALWDSSIQPNCWSPKIETNIAYAHTAFNGATDLFLTCLPAVMLSKLRIARRVKIGLMFLLGLSFLAFIAVMVKLVHLSVLEDRADYTYNTVLLFIWVAVEGAVIIVIASVPLLPPLFSTKRRNRSAQSYRPRPYLGSRPPGNANNSLNKLNAGNMELRQTDTTSDDMVMPFQIEIEYESYDA